MYDEPCEAIESAGETERADEADECLEWESERPRDGGRRLPSFAVMELRKSALLKIVNLETKRS